MKKLVLTTALVLSSLIASANFVKFNTSLVSFDNTITTQTVDTTLVSNTLDTAITFKLTKVVFYDIDHLTIKNSNNKYIRIENSNGDVIKETHSDVDIALIPGNYYVYTSCSRLIAKYH